VTKQIESAGSHLIIVGAREYSHVRLICVGSGPIDIVELRIGSIQLLNPKRVLGLARICRSGISRIYGE
jgi:hypothetical protein